MSKIFPRLNCLVYHGEGNPCNCDMDREEPIAKTIDQFKQELIKAIEDDIDYDGEIYSTEYRNGQERAIEIIKNK